MTSRTSSTKDCTASSINTLSDCNVEVQLFLFFFAEGGVSTFLYSVPGMAKNLRELTLQNPNPEEINREQLIKNPGAFPQVCSTLYATPYA